MPVVDGRNMLTITALVPTYRRPQDLARCLAALKQQTRSANDIVLVVRDNDANTWSFLEKFDSHPLPLRIATVHVSGVVAALNVGLAMATGEIIAITDDDAAPHLDWLERIEGHFLSNENLGGLGGRDCIHLNSESPNDVIEPDGTKVIGKVQWFGRIINNHHLGMGAPRKVDFLKGVNMSYRKAAITGLCFDDDLRGTGAQVHNELAFSLSVKRRGWELIYDPAVCVDHYPAQRFDEDKRKTFSYIACLNIAYNETIILLDNLLEWQKYAYLIWSILIGSRATYGMVQVLRFLPVDGGLALQRLIASMQGRWLAWRAWQKKI
jgi:cellulose synthase/poly-beta-1,6-N-acetylglucosamine synthase-like glycosyltransferase